MTESKVKIIIGMEQTELYSVEAKRISKMINEIAENGRKRAQESHNYEVVQDTYRVQIIADMIYRQASKYL